MQPGLHLTPWLTLALTEGVGPVAGASLLRAFGTPQAILGASGQALEAAGARPALIRRLLGCDARRDARIAQALEWVTLPDAHIVTCADPDYPPGLADIHDPPLILFLRGTRPWLTRPMLAIVGSRNASLHGTDTATEIAQGLADAGWTVVSGLALGIDAAAHQGALNGSAGTLAVLGSGIDRIYPKQHQGLAQAICRHGAVLSELPPGTPPAPAFFPLRNRIIAGLTRGVVVVEAALQSGSLITARLANECGREVFAVPGPVRSALSRGCHQLIREGATLVESAAQVLEVCPAPQARSAPASQPAGVAHHSPQDPLQERILAALQGGAAHPDQLARHLDLPIQDLAAPLLALELQGRLITGHQGQVSPCEPQRQLASAQFRLL